MTGFGPYEAVAVATTSDELRAYIREAIEETAGHREGGDRVRTRPLVRWLVVGVHSACS